MVEVVIEVRAPLVARFRCTALLLFEASAESLHLTLSALQRDPRAIEEARDHFARLNELATLLDQTGWQASDAAASDLLVEASADVLHDAVLGSLLDAGEALGEGTADRATDIPGLAEEVVALDELLKEVARYR